MKKEIHNGEGYKLMAVAFEVYNAQGHGMAEEIHQECLEIELGIQAIPFRSKQELACFYKGQKLKKQYMPDLFVFDCLVVKKYPKLQLRTVKELLAGNGIEHPSSMASVDETFKKAPKSKKKDSEQKELVL